MAVLRKDHVVVSFIHRRISKVFNEVEIVFWKNRRIVCKELYGSIKNIQKELNALLNLKPKVYKE